jgi:hypothetical protein
MHRPSSVTSAQRSDLISPARKARFDRKDDDRLYMPPPAIARGEQFRFLDGRQYARSLNLMRFNYQRPTQLERRDFHPGVFDRDRKNLSNPFQMMIDVRNASLAAVHSLAIGDRLLVFA